MVAGTALPKPPRARLRPATPSEQRYAFRRTSLAGDGARAMDVG